MNEEPHEPAPESGPAAEPSETIERRSLDAVMQGAEATGVLAGGLGTLALGVSKLKETFGSSGEQGAEPAPQPSESPASSDEPK